jgi:hypothetical protein
LERFQAEVERNTQVQNCIELEVSRRARGEFDGSEEWSKGFLQGESYSARELHEIHKKRTHINKPNTQALFTN